MLKIDLLPRHFAVARTNKIVLVGMIALLVLVLLGWGTVIMGTKSKIAKAEADFDAVHDTADEVRDILAETSSKQAQLQPIADKVGFIEEADQSGGQFWERFHAINQYIYDKAQVTNLSITMPNQFNMQVIVGDTTECARFVLNLIRCPALAPGISISGLPAGVSIEGAGGASVSFSPAGGMGGDPGMDATMDPGMEGMGGGGPSTSVTAAGEIALSVSATLVEQVNEPMPPGMGGGAPMGGMGGMGGMDPMMGPGMEGMEDMGGAPPEGDVGAPAA